MIRPKSIRQFELFYLGAVLASAVANAMNWSAAMASDQGQQVQKMLGLWFMPLAAVFGVTVSLLLWYFTARVPSRIAKWAVVILYVISLAGLAMNLMNGVTLDASWILSAVSVLLNTAAVWFLFRPDLNTWFGKA